MVLFVMRRGVHTPAVTRSLHWENVAVVEAESVASAVSAAKEAIAEWAEQGLTAEKWILEGRREYINVTIPLWEVHET